jgi:hypothetical protein
MATDSVVLYRSNHINMGYRHEQWYWRQENTVSGGKQFILNKTLRAKATMTKGRFQKGQTGNAGGRPKRTAEELDLIEACKTKAPEALEVIYQIMRNADDDRLRLAAALAIIERGYGKPMTPTEISGKYEAALNNIVVTFVRPGDEIEGIEA